MGERVSYERLVELREFHQHRFDFWGRCYGKEIAGDTLKALDELTRLRSIERAARAYLTLSQSLDTAYHECKDGIAPKPVCDAYSLAKEELRTALQPMGEK